MGIAENWSRENLAWAAGLFEGEGSINKRGTLLTVTSTDEDVVRRFAKIVGVGKIVKHIPANGQLGKKIQWIWNVYRQEYGQALLAAFWPWLGERRRQRAAHFIKMVSTSRERQIRRGEKSGRSVLTEAQVLEILSSKETTVFLSSRFGVGQTTISAIRTRKTWRHLDGFGRHLQRTSVEHCGLSASV